MEILDSQSSNEIFIQYCKELKAKTPINDKVLFINCPQFNLDTFEPDVARSRGYYAYPPIGLQSLVSSINNRGLDARILDLNYELLNKVNHDLSFNAGDWLSILKEQMKKTSPSVIGISSLFAVDFPAFKKIARYFRSIGRNIIIAGGQNATYNSGRFLEEGLCDFICERESENKINFLFDQLFQNDGNKSTPGIVFRYDGKIEKTNGERDIVVPNGNLIDSYNLVDVERYCNAGSLSPYSRMAGKDTPFATVSLNRGCGVGCKMCDVVDYMGKGVRSRQVNDVLEEIAYLYSQRGIRHFEFIDDDFARNSDISMSLLDGIIQKNMKISWASNNGIIAKTLNESLLEKMQDSGCIGFKIGVESGNSKILKKIHKPGNLDFFKYFSRIAQKFEKMFIVDNYIIGFPEESFGQMLDTYHFSKIMNLDWSSFAVYQQNVSYNKNEGSRNIEELGDFVPTKDSLRGKILNPNKILEGVEIFNITSEDFPSKEQVNQIWFTFNLARNFVYNKNLCPDDRIKKFISWTEAIHERYPTHPYISMFLSLAYHLDKDVKKAEAYTKKTIEGLTDEYWRLKFNRLSLTEITKNFPRNMKQSKEAINFLREAYHNY